MDDNLYQVIHLIYRYLDNKTIINLVHTCRTLFKEDTIYNYCNYYVILEGLFGESVDIRVVTFGNFNKTILNKIVKKYKKVEIAVEVHDCDSIDLRDIEIFGKNGFFDKITHLKIYLEHNDADIPNPKIPLKLTFPHSLKHLTLYSFKPNIITNIDQLVNLEIFNTNSFTLSENKKRVILPDSIKILKISWSESIQSFPSNLKKFIMHNDLTHFSKDIIDIPTITNIPKCIEEIRLPIDIINNVEVQNFLLYDAKKLKKIQVWPLFALFCYEFEYEDIKFLLKLVKNEGIQCIIVETIDIIITKKSVEEDILELVKCYNRSVYFSTESGSSESE